MIKAAVLLLWAVFTATAQALSITPVTKTPRQPVLTVTEEMMIISLYLPISSILLPTLYSHRRRRECIW